MNYPGLSIVVIGRNEGRRLQRCLESIHEMHRPADGLEIIYVDSGSVDGSREAASETGIKVVVLKSGRFTAGRARQAGARAASAPFLFFVDGDTVVAAEFAVRALEEFRDPHVAVVFGRTHELDARRSVFHRAFDLQWRTFPLVSPETSMGTAMMRRSAFDAAGGYDPDIPCGEDAEICGRLRRRGFLARGLDVPMVAHDLTMTGWSQYWWRMVRNGYGCADVIDRFAPPEMTLLRSRVQHAWIWGVLLLLLPAAAATCSIVFRSWFPVGILVGFLAATLLLASWRTYRATGERLNSIVFAVHMYAKEVPRMIGQMRFYRDKRKRQRTLIDYRTSSRTVYGIR